jgi:hypothetical protein
MLTFWDADPNDGFELYVNDRQLATIQLAGERPDEFVEGAFPIPSELSSRAKDGIRVKLVAKGARTARLFDVRLLQAR